MSIDLKQLREYIIRPTLKAITLWGESDENLIVGTGSVESDWSMVKQVNGRALGFMQIEPATYGDLRSRLITMPKYKPTLLLVLKALQFEELPQDPDFLMGNICASVIFARLKYHMAHSIEPTLPKATDYIALATLHKTVYNTSGGETDLQRSIKIFRAAIYGYVYHGN